MNESPNPFLRHVFAGAIAGAFNDSIMHPIDTIRARINLNQGISNSESPFSAFTTTFRATLQSQGTRGLYRGFSSVLLFSMPGNGIYFSVYEKSKAKLSSDFGLYSEPIAGLLAQFAVSFLWTPYDIVKQRMQTQDMATTIATTKQTKGFTSTPPSLSAPSTLRNELNILIKNGELFRGLVASWIVWAPFSVVYFGVFESYRRVMINQFHFNSDWKIDLMSGSVAGIAGAIVSQPADAVKTRLQVLRGDDFMIDGFWKGTQDIIRKEGHGALWRGVVARVCWLAPGTALTITAFEALKGVGY